MSGSYFFDSADEIVQYLFSLNENISPLKLQKSLYFLFAYYGSTYGAVKQNDIDEEIVEIEKTYPQYLFPGKFEAWKYGPVIPEVYFKNKSEGYVAKPIEDGKYDPDVILYLEELFEQLNGVSDFTLVERSHMDKSWEEVFEKSGQTLVDQEMDNDAIIQEYKRRYV